MLSFGDPVPDLRVTSQYGDFGLRQRLWGRWSVVMFHPAAVTAVCETEILQCTGERDVGDGRRTVISIVPERTVRLRKWLSGIERTHGVRVTHDCVADEHRAITRCFGFRGDRDILSPRGYFIFDPEYRLRSWTILPREVGFCSAELQRVMLAMALTRHGEMLAPANWRLGRPMLDAEPTATCWNT